MLDTLNTTWKKLCKVHGRFCKKLTEIPNWAAIGFAEMGVGKERRVHRRDSEVLVQNDVFRPRTAGEKKQPDEWQKSNNECEKLDCGVDRARG
jgi:hypothetical protein